MLLVLGVGLLKEVVLPDVRVSLVSDSDDMGSLT